MAIADEAVASALPDRHGGDASLCSGLRGTLAGTGFCSPGLPGYSPRHHPLSASSSFLLLLRPHEWISGVFSRQCIFRHWLPV